MVPEGWSEIKNVTGVFINKNEKRIVITGCPGANDEKHNCDQMGCSSVSHVILFGSYKVFSGEIKEG